MFDPHVIAGNWNVNHPVGFVVSDMTIFKNGIKMRAKRTLKKYGWSKKAI